MNPAERALTWEEMDGALAARLRRVAPVCGAIVALIGASALAGWILGSETLKGGIVEGVTVKTNTALALLLCGLSLLLLSPERPRRASRWAGRLLAAVAGLIGLATLSQHVFGWDLGIDNLLFREASGAAATQSPNRMGPPASLSFPLLGAALLLLGHRTRRGRVPSQLLALAALSIVLLSLLGYVFGVRELYGLARYTGIALHTSLAFLLLSLGVLLARPELGLMRRVSARGSGGLLVRRMLPPAVLLPILLSWLHIAGEEAGLYGNSFGHSALSLTFIVALVSLTWWIGAAISRHEGAASAARSAARASELRFREIADSAPQLIWHAAADGTSLFHNRRYLEFLGPDFQPRSLEDHLERLHPDDRPAAAEAFRDALAQARPYGIELRQLRHDGVYRWLRFQVAPVLDPAGAVTAWTASGMDVHDERLATARNETLYRLASALSRARSPREVAECVLRVAMSSVGACASVLAVLDEDSGWFTNLAVFGYEPSGGRSYPGFPVGARVPVADAVARGLPVILESAEERDRRYPNLARLRPESEDGASISMPVLLGDRTLGGLALGFRGPRRFDEADLAFFGAITDHCAQALDRMANYEQARASAERYRSLAHAMPALVWASGPDGRPTFVNAAWREYTGVEREQAGESDWKQFVHPGDRASLEASWARATSRAEPLEAEFRYLRHDGEPRWFLGRSVPVFDEAGRATQWIGVFFDITDRMQAEEALRRNVQELSDTQNHLRRADRLKDEFLATLAHELRNPLAPIRSAVEILKVREQADPEALWARDVIGRQVEHMTRLLEDLLDVSRVTRNRLELRRQRVPVAQVVQHGVETSRPVIESAGHALTVSLPDAEIWIEVDPLRISQVVSNLLNNAAKYTDRGGRIALAVEREGSDVVLSIRDTGIGISPEHLPHVFDLFTQATPALERSQGGLGIGLALVRGIVEAHGGHVEARSQGLGRGSEFRVRLPALVGGEAEAARARAERGSPRAARPLRVLLADDNADGRESLALYLRIAGHEVHVAEDGKQAVEIAERVRPEVALLDIGMPRLNGYDAARALRERPWGGDVVLAAVTGWGQHEDRQRAAEAGFQHHLVKPVEPGALLELLNRIAAGTRRTG